MATGILANFPISTEDQRQLSKLGLPTTLAPRGVFAPNPISTPKYSRHTSPRGDEYRDTMARMFIKLDPTAYDKFTTSIRATGDTTTITLSKLLTSTTNSSTQGGSGYIDFILQRIDESLSERFDLVELLSDNYVVYYFGSTPPIFRYSGVLINSKEDDQASNMFRIYKDIVRGSQLAHRGALISMRYNDQIVSGSINSFSNSFESSNEMVVPFGFELLVKSITTLPNPRATYVPLTEQTGIDSISDTALIEEKEGVPLKTTMGVVTSNTGGFRERMVSTLG